MSFQLGNIEVTVPEPEVFDTRDVPGDLPPEQLLRAQRAFALDPQRKNLQLLLAAEVLRAAYGADLDRLSVERLIKILRTPSLDPLPDSKTLDPVGVALRRVRQAKSDQGRQRALQGVRAARVEIAIRRAREMGMGKGAQTQVARKLLRGVT